MIPFYVMSCIGIGVSAVIVRSARSQCGAAVAVGDETLWCSRRSVMGVFAVWTTDLLCRGLIAVEAFRCKAWRHCCRIGEVGWELTRRQRCRVYYERWWTSFAYALDVLVTSVDLVKCTFCESSLEYIWARSSTPLWWHRCGGIGLRRQSFLPTVQSLQSIR